MSITPDKKNISVKEALALALLPAGVPLTLSGLYGSSKAYLLSEAFKASKRQLLAVLPDPETAEEFAADLKFFLSEGVCLYPTPETLPFELAAPHQELSAARMEALNTLLSGSPAIVVASAQSLMQRVVPREYLSGKSLDIAVGSEYPREALLQGISDLGYSRMSLVEERGEVSVRGGILDIFPPMYAHPLRIEFFGDEVESIRNFEISTQRSLGDLKEARILPAREAALKRDSRGNARERLIERAEELGLKRDVWETLSARLRDGSVYGMDALLPYFHERLETVFDYLGKDALVAIIDSESSYGGIKGYWASVLEASARLASKGQFHVRPEDLYLEEGAARGLLGAFATVRIEPLVSEGERIQTESNLDLRQELSIRKGEELLKPLAERIGEWTFSGQKVFITAHNKGQSERARELLADYGIEADVKKRFEFTPNESEGTTIVIGSLKTGFRLPSEGLVIVSEEEVFGERVKRRSPPSRRLEAFLTQLQDLSEGDCIVHKAHGIGLYRGLKRLNIDGVEGDFLLLEYRGGDRLYLPVWRMDLVSKYHGFEGGAPELDKLGGPGWEKKKTKVRHAVERLAGELLKLYAEREVAEGFAFSPPERTFHEFEAAFEYEETPDQARAIEETLSDMLAPRPMDRLVCGDVGYGKTEVAIRAAFKAVLDKKQVAVLVPTTVLAQQHGSTFAKRLSSYPVIVESLSRFRTASEQKDIIKRLAEGKVDIVIGTHRLLQKDIVFKDLGLIVIDEEHRFGVAHKERLKQLRKKVDVLTLTATPIPRTLHMSLASVRELSIINTPPEDRLAIKTTVMRFDEAAISEAIERELNRGGQVFFVHNRIQSMGAMEEFLRRIVPQARVAVAHGQMKEGELEKRMMGFVKRDYDILLSTAIIESGLDIPSANTIIINRADRFGLAELYQLRGRVGRSSHRAYAYFICPSIMDLSEDARKRMEVIQELCEPGSGFKIATYDLEIRGAGELLGAAQSGHIAAVGFETYTELLEEAVRGLKGEEVAEEVEPEINLKVSQYIPEEYIPDTRLRLGFYKRIASLKSEEEMDGLKEELEDRFGEIPALLENLLKITLLKLDLKLLNARELSLKGARLNILFPAEGGADERVISTAVEMMKKEPKRYRITPDGRFVVFMPAEADVIETARGVLKGFLKASGVA